MRSNIHPRPLLIDGLAKLSTAYAHRQDSCGQLQLRPCHWPAYIHYQDGSNIATSLRPPSQDSSQRKQPRTGVLVSHAKCRRHSTAYTHSQGSNRKQPTSTSWTAANHDSNAFDIDTLRSLAGRQHKSQTAHVYPRGRAANDYNRALVIRPQLSPDHQQNSENDTSHALTPTSTCRLAIAVNPRPPAGRRAGFTRPRLAQELMIPG